MPCKAAKLRRRKQLRCLDPCEAATLRSRKQRKVFMAAEGGRVGKYPVFLIELPDDGYQSSCSALTRAHRARSADVSRKPLPAAPDVCAGGRPAGSDRKAPRRRAGRTRVPDAAGRDRLREDVHDGARDRAHRLPGAHHGAEQDARRPALFRDARVLSGECDRVFRFVLRLLSARGLRALEGSLYREGLEHQRAHRADAALGDQIAPRAPRHHHRRDRVMHLRYRRSGGVSRNDSASARAREARAARCDQAAHRDAVPA